MLSSSFFFFFQKRIQPLKVELRTICLILLCLKNTLGTTGIALRLVQQNYIIVSTQFC